LIVDSAGNTIKRVDYDSFGNIISDSNASFEVPFGFSGGLHDIDTGLVRFGARDFDPGIGRWTAKDPIDFAGGDVNLYGYVQNNPVNFVDPFGYIAGIPDNLIGTGLVGAGFVFISTGNPVVGISLVIAGGYFLVDSPITKYFIQKPLEETVEDLAEKYFEDLDEFDNKCKTGATK